MTITMAREITATYDACVKVHGLEWTEKHYLAKGTERYLRNFELLRRAQEILNAARKGAGK